jgi:OOP family OmpA-OmpF porin
MRLVGPRSVVTVAGLGEGGVRSAPRSLKYRVESPVLVTTIYFGIDKDTLDRQAKKRLTKLADIIRIEVFRRMRVEGHADSVSSEKYNRSLSQRRIDSTVAFLLRKLKDLNISEKALGELFPAATNATPEGRAMNRRVEISVW